MLGMIPGNGHPYSWSAIINGYDPVHMAACPYAAIPQYLGAQPLEAVRIPCASVTHLWTDDPAEASGVAAAAKIPNIVAKPEDVIGEVDAVIISTDDGADHVRRARPFVEAGLPVFVDKPMATTPEELAQFISWKNQGAQILSSSGMRYAPELSELENSRWMWMTSITCKTWERYGIHALEPVFKLLGAGFTQVRTCHRQGADIVTCEHASGVTATVAAVHEAYGSFGVIHAYGGETHRSVQMKDTYSAFRNQLLAVIAWLESGTDPYPFDDTVELMAVILAGIESRKRGGEAVRLEEVLKGVQP